MTAAAAAALFALAQGLPTVTVTRGERTILVAQRATGAEGARTVLANRNCEPGFLTNVFFGPVAGYVETRFDETLLLSQIAVVRVPGDGSEDDETVELFGGLAVFDRPGCLAEVDDAEGRAVELRQGRTTIEGTRFFLDRGTDVAVFEGPVTLTRAPAAGDGRPPLEATATSMTFDVERERATLIGDVVVISGERTSSAEELDLDEAAGVAILTGSPAVSRRGADEVRGSTLRYDLETDEVVATGAVFATFEIAD